MLELQRVCTYSFQELSEVQLRVHNQEERKIGKGYQSRGHNMLLPFLHLGEGKEHFLDSSRPVPLLWKDESRLKILVQITRYLSFKIIYILLEKGEDKHD